MSRFRASSLPGVIHIRWAVDEADRFRDAVADVTTVVWQATGTTPTRVPVAPSVEVHRRAGYDTLLGFYSVDAITGTVAGPPPR